MHRDQDTRGTRHEAGPRQKQVAPLPRVVIVGAGFGGLQAARALGKVPVQLTVIDRNNHHLFQPLLYQVATGMLSPAEICSPLRHILRKHTPTEVVMAEVTGIDVEAQQVLMHDRPLLCRCGSRIHSTRRFAGLAHLGGRASPLPDRVSQSVCDALSVGLELSHL